VCQPLENMPYNPKLKLVAHIEKSHATLEKLANLKIIYEEQ